MSRNITVVGAGLVGRGWAIVFARAGHKVKLFDLTEEKIADAFRIIDIHLDDLAAYHLVAEQSEIRGRIQGSTDLAEAVSEADWVQECVFEDLGVKRNLFNALDAQAPVNATLASSTSTFPGSAFTAGLKGRQRCLVAHPINPPYLVPLVEIVPTSWTSPETTALAREFMASVGQVPIVLRREVRGFIVNRLQVALLSEAFRLVEDDIIGAIDLDHAIADGLGLRWAFMGPFETIDLNAPGGIRDYVERLGKPYYEIAVEQSPARKWDESLVARIEKDRRSVLAADQLTERQRWRDLYLMSIVATKNSRRES
ncbi:MAG TPA: 3-hydroxyacyl-CoA dehydrogenase [Chthoniobacterales bacterium]|nr:3-hydroxyacyl-CoA dehydrogenase [Chthoniobacterales bacterium]